MIRSERFLDIVTSYTKAAAKLSLMAFAAFVLGWFAVQLGDCDLSLERHAIGAEPTEEAVFSAVRILQPSHSPAVAAAWGGVIYEAGAESGIDPLLIASIAFRESSIQADVVGDLGEEGAMQIHGAAIAYAPRECQGNMLDMRCNIRTGAAVLQWWRAECQDERWAVWVGAYGFGRCPTYDEAVSHPSVQRARSLYDRVGGTEWNGGPS